MSHLRPWSAALVLLALSGAGPALAEDAPAPAPAAPKAATRWILGFRHGPLKRVAVDDGTSRKQTYLYMTMAVENRTGLPRPWRPLVTATVDTRSVPYVAAGLPEAFAAVRRQEMKPDLKSLDETAFQPGEEGKIPDGATWEFFAVFGPVDPGWGSFRVDVFGLVNPVTIVKVQKYGDKQIVLEAAYGARNEKVRAELEAAARAAGSSIPTPAVEYQEIRERRSYVMQYRRQGDEFRPDDDPIEFVSEGWEVLGEPKVLRVIQTKT